MKSLKEEIILRFLKLVISQNYGKGYDYTLSALESRLGFYAVVVEI